MPLSGKFTFVLIPNDVNESIKEIEASKSGGLEQDELLKYANQYFANQQNNNSATNKSTTNDTHQQQQHLQSIIDQATPSVNITAVTVPTKDNGYTACSLYSINYCKDTNYNINQRATDLLTACGHTVIANTSSTTTNDTNGGNAIYGDAFCGRAYDDETKEWERINIYANDIHEGADWCRIARKMGGGGGAGRAAAASLSNLAQQITNQSSKNSSGGKAPMEIVGDSNNNNVVNSYGMDGTDPVVESWGTWTQTNDEVEIKIAVPVETTSKQCQIQFHTHRIKVTINNQVLIDGISYDPIAIDESTYTIQNGYGPTGRELCITIGKAEPGRTWMFIAK